MNQLLLVAIALVLFIHFGGSNVPKILKDNKQMVYGITIGLVLCSFFGNNVEGLNCDEIQAASGVDCCSLNRERCRGSTWCDQTGKHYIKRPWVSNRLTLGIGDDPYPTEWTEERQMGQCGCNNYAQDPDYHCEQSEQGSGEPAVSSQEQNRLDCQLNCTRFAGGSKCRTACNNMFSQDTPLPKTK